MRSATHPWKKRERKQQISVLIPAARVRPERDSPWIPKMAMKCIFLNVFFQKTYRFLQVWEYHVFWHFMNTFGFCRKTMGCLWVKSMGFLSEANILGKVPMRKNGLKNNSNHAKLLCFKIAWSRNMQQTTIKPIQILGDGQRNRARMSRGLLVENRGFRNIPGGGSRKKDGSLFAHLN